MHQLLQYQYFLQNFHPGKIIFHVNLINALDRHQFISQNFLPEVNLPKASLPKQLYKFVEIQ